IVCLYVDDLLIIAPALTDIDALKATISLAFPMKDLGVLKYLLGMEITFGDRSVSISQKKYIEDMLKVYDMHHCTHFQELPAPAGHRLTKAPSPLPPDESLTMREIKYRHAVGHLLYLTMVTRFDLSKVVCELSRHMSNPSPTHWGAVRWCMKYVSGTEAKKLHLGPFPCEGPLKLIGYSDSDWAGYTNTQRSTTGYAFVL
ncbi:unnamed protein product, partial [Phaeothamnion confervicola]